MSHTPPQNLSSAIQTKIAEELSELFAIGSQYNLTSWDFLRVQKSKKRCTLTIGCSEIMKTAVIDLQHRTPKGTSAEARTKTEDVLADIMGAEPLKMTVTVQQKTFRKCARNALYSFWCDLLLFAPALIGSAIALYLFVRK